MYIPVVGPFIFIFLENKLLFLFSCSTLHLFTWTLKQMLLHYIQIPLSIDISGYETKDSIKVLLRSLYLVVMIDCYC